MPAARRAPVPGPARAAAPTSTVEAVAGAQRARLLHAIVAAVARKGYAAATVADVVALAGVSRRTFYEQFEDKEDCFVAAFELGVDIALEAIATAVAELDRDDWRGRLRAGLEAYLSVLAANPEAARALHVEVFAAGGRALERRAQMMQRFVRAYSELHAVAAAELATGTAPPEERLLALVGGIDEIVREHARRGRAEQLAKAAPALSDLAEDVVAGTCTYR